MRVHVFFFVIFACFYTGRPLCGRKLTPSWWFWGPPRSPRGTFSIPQPILDHWALVVSVWVSQTVFRRMYLAKCTLLASNEHIFAVVYDCLSRFSCNALRKPHTFYSLKLSVRMFGWCLGFGWREDLCWHHLEGSCQTFRASKVRLGSLSTASCFCWACLGRNAHFWKSWRLLRDGFGCFFQFCTFVSISRPIFDLLSERGWGNGAAQTVSGRLFARFTWVLLLVLANCIW